MNVEIVADTLSPDGARITTFQLRYPRFIHSQIMTHRVFSRNARSSRAVPVRKIIEEVRENPVIPVMAQNKSGMQPGDPFPYWKLEAASLVWHDAIRDAIKHAETLQKMGVHKQWANRILEPFMYIDVLITATEWDNFFALRCAHDSQTEIQALAIEMKRQYLASAPEESLYHIPYVDEEFPEGLSDEDFDHELDRLFMISAARCARISYKPFNSDTADEDADILLANKLWDAGHLSPFEHQAMASYHDEHFFNLKGWVSFRYEKETYDE